MQTRLAAPRPNRAATLAAAVGVALGLVAAGLLWFAAGAGGGSVFERTAVPRTPLEQDVAWPLPWELLALAGVLAGFAGYAAWRERQRPDRFDPAVILGAPLAAVGMVLAIHALRASTQSDTYITASYVFDAALAASGAGALAALLGLLRMAAYSLKGSDVPRGAGLAIGSVFMPLCLQWAVYRFVITPDHAQPSPWSEVLELPTVPRARLFVPRTRDSAQLPIAAFLEQGELRIHVDHPDCAHPSWRTCIELATARMEPDPDAADFGIDGAGLVDGTARIRADALLPAGQVLDILDILDELRRSGIYRIWLATNLADVPSEGQLTSFYLTPPAPAPRPADEVAVEMRLSKSSSPTYRIHGETFAGLQSLLAHLRQDAVDFDILRVDERASWGAVAVAFSAIFELHGDVGELGRLKQPAARHAGS